MEIFHWNKKINPKWITECITVETIKWTENFGYYLADEIKRDANENKIQKRDNNGRLITRNGRPVYEKQAILTTNQLRKFFGEIRRIQAELIGKNKDSSFDKSKLLLIKPKLAYQVGREKDKEGKIKDFYEQVCLAIDNIQDEKSFQRFVDIIEAIVAYHKVKESEKTDKKEEDN